MKWKIKTFFCLFFLSLNLSVVYAGWAERAKPIKSGIGWNYPLVYGDKLIFDSGGGKARGTHVYDIKTGKVKSLTSGGVHSGKSISGDNMVFKEEGSRRRINLFNLKTKKTTEIGEGDTFPSISSNWVVYGVGKARVNEIALYDLNKKEFKKVELEGRLIVGPAAYGDMAVWLERKDDGREVITSFDLKTGKIKEHYAFFDETIERVQCLKYQGDFVLLSGRKDVYIYDISRDIIKKLTKPGQGRIFLSDINGGKVVWDSNGGETIYLYDIAKDEYTELVSKGAEAYSPAVSGKKVFFVDYKKFELRMFEFKD